MTYLTPSAADAWTAAHAITYAGVGSVFAARTAAWSSGIGCTAADADRRRRRLLGADVARVFAGAAFAGAVFGAAGALAGAVARHPAIASGRRRRAGTSARPVHARRHTDGLRTVPALPAYRVADSAWATRSQRAWPTAFCSAT